MAFTQNKSSVVVTAKVCPKLLSSVTPMPVSLLSCEHSRRATFLSPINFSLPSIRPFRALQPATQPRILVSDTVGFIRNLPHDLVASFRSTLDEALDASLLQRSEERRVGK